MGKNEIQDKMISMEKLEQIVRSLFEKGKSPSTIGHILRDCHNLRIPKLTRVFPFLNQSKSQYEALNLKIQYIKLHLANNKKDVPTQRTLQRLTVKLNKLKLSLK